LITHTAVIRPILDYTLIALEGRGRVIVGDAPIQSCEFGKLLELSRIEELLAVERSRYPDVEFQVEDWRLTVMEERRLLGRRVDAQKTTAADDERYTLVDLKGASFLADIDDYSDRFRVTCYNPDLMLDHHHPGRHEYLVTSRVFEADAIINVPKMKTHIKAGLTGALKNLVGINGHKEFLAHHIKGSYTEGGDNYVNPSVFKRWYENFDEKVWRAAAHGTPIGHKARSFFLGLLWRMWRLGSRDRVIAGSWAGNETVWRTTLDLNHILYYYDVDERTLSGDPVRKVFTVVDGIVSGQGQGPLAPEPFPAGVVMAGFNPCAVDAVMATLMGYNLSRIPTVHNALYDVRSLFNVSRHDELTVLEQCGDVCLEKTLSQLTPMRCKSPKYWSRAMSGNPYPAKRR
jgi:hypothetical protein